MAGGDEKLTSATNTNDFHFAETIDKGSFGKVVLEKSDREVFDMKVLRKENVCGRNQVERNKTGSNVLDVCLPPVLCVDPRCASDPEQVTLRTRILCRW